MGKTLALLGLSLLLSGCASLVPLTSLISTPTGPPPIQVHDETSVKLQEGNFELVKTNVVGRSKGFSLLGIVTIVPATINKAMGRFYGAAQMEKGQSQTLAHLIIEQTSSYYILFGIPEVDVRADIVRFEPDAENQTRKEAVVEQRERGPSEPAAASNARAP